MSFFGLFGEGHRNGGSCGWTTLSILALEYATPQATQKLMHVCRGKIALILAVL